MNQSSKLFEVRDEGTCIPVMATRFAPENEQERYLLARAGYGLTPAAQTRFVSLCAISRTSQWTTDPHCWTGCGRTMQEAHLFIAENFDRLYPGDVVDVEFILGERATPKCSGNPSLPRAKVAA